MTPRQFDLLCRRRREDLIHRELCSAYTTSAVINFSDLRPDEPVPATQFMPNHRDNEAPAAARQWDEETLDRISDYNVVIAAEAARQRRQAAESGQ
jgi:hypothetical protein